MEYSYMVVAFIDDFRAGLILEPPKHPHITVKKKFKLLDIDEKQLIKMLNDSKRESGSVELHLGDLKDYDSDANQVLEVLNPETWAAMHRNIVDLLSGHIESRDPHFEGDNYLPHVTWKLKGSVTLNPDQYKNKTYSMKKLYLIQRIDPVISKAKIIAVINL